MILTQEQKQAIDSIIYATENRIKEIAGVKCHLVLAGKPERIYGVDKDIILASVVNISGFTFEQILGKSRYRPLSEVRQLTMKLLRDKGKMTYVEIGSYLGGRDHSTALYGCNIIIDLLAQSWELRQLYNAILNDINNTAQKDCAVNLTK